MRHLLISLVVLLSAPACLGAESLVYDKKIIHIYQAGEVATPVAAASSAEQAPPVTPPEKVISFSVDMRPPEVLESDLIVGSPFPDGEGMLIDFSDEQIISVPMQTVFAARDLIFITTDNKISEIVADASSQTLTSVESTKPAKILLQINAGQAAEKNLKEGDRFEIEQGVEIKKQGDADADIPADSRTAN
jgi:uncharacterized membrane protein (UPF0127 family)